MEHAAQRRGPSRQRRGFAVRQLRDLRERRGHGDRAARGARGGRGRAARARADRPRHATRCRARCRSPMRRSTSRTPPRWRSVSPAATSRRSRAGSRTGCTSRTARHLYPRSMELVERAGDLGALGATISGAGPPCCSGSSSSRPAPWSSGCARRRRLGRGPPPQLRRPGRGRRRALEISAISASKRVSVASGVMSARLGLAIWDSAGDAGRPATAQAAFPGRTVRLSTRSSALRMDCARSARTAPATDRSFSVARAIRSGPPTAGGSPTTRHPRPTSTSSRRTAARALP